MDQYVTLSGVPISLELEWPFHRSTSGSDWHVLHGTVKLLTEPLEAEVAVSVSQTIAQALPSLDREWAQPLVVNAIRKTIDNTQIEFLKSGKRQPVHVSSRYYSFRLKKISFMTQPESEIRELLQRKAYWLGTRTANGQARMADPIDCQYVNAEPAKMLEIARQLETEGLLRLQGENAQATEKLLLRADEIRAAMRRGVEAGVHATKMAAG